jgi:hypothetical protein
MTTLIPTEILIKALLREARAARTGKAIILQEAPGRTIRLIKREPRLYDLEEEGRSLIPEPSALPDLIPQISAIIESKAAG